jgi:hypothetical protein
MTEVEVGKDLIDKAELRSSAVSKTSTLLHKYGSEKKRIFEGYLGEEIVKEYLGIPSVDDDYEYDLISNKGKRLEVKTISCKFKPHDDYLCTVNSSYLDSVRKQDADYYVFIRVLNSYDTAWLLGYIECDKFFELGNFIEKGTDMGKFKFVKANATVLPIYKLNQF